MSDHYFCKNKGRRRAIRGQENPRFNGIDYLEVMPDQKTLKIHFIFSVQSELKKDNVIIEGGERIKDIRVNNAAISDDRKVLTVELNNYGDFSTYTLYIVESGSENLPGNLDPQLSMIDFSFKVQCLGDLDCKREIQCPPEKYEEPDINYLAKDYTGFKNLMMDRLSVILPDWKERNPADLMVALVELLAYTGDNLSYYQDAVATEAYLGTARKRTSIRRHARLLDYFMHEGCNARSWVHFEVDGGEEPLVSDVEVNLPANVPLITGQNNSCLVDLDRLNDFLGDGAIVFETMHETTLHSAHNDINFYTWDDSECCLPRGSTRATLIDRDELLKLNKGDVLVFEEMKSPMNGKPEDADPAHRHVVRLIDVKPGKDKLNDIPVVEIEWDEEDALPFPLCISAKNENGTVIPDISVAHGNIVLADHGRTIDDSPVPDTVPDNGSFNPGLSRSPLTYKVAFDPEIFIENKKLSAASVMQWDVKKALPDITLSEKNVGDWTHQFDLLTSEKFSYYFVVETESDGTANIRFGDGIFGKKPTPGSVFTARYRIGNGKAGNVGAETISRVALPDRNEKRIKKVRNPLAASGGIDPEPMEHVRIFAPYAFRTQERAVTEEDYSMIALKHKEIQRATATIRWTGSWHTVFITIDRKGGTEVDQAFKDKMKAFFDRYRTAGYDLEINGPVYIPLDISLAICVKPGYYRSDVKRSLLEVFSDQELENGMRGFFHPDNFTFGQTVYLDSIFDAAQKVPGVASIKVEKFQRWGKDPAGEFENGFLAPGRIEVIRLDNDPNFPQNGRIDFIMNGGL